MRKLINFNSTGIFNVGIGKKVYVNQIVTWLNFYNKNICRRVNLLKKFNKDRFYLDNKKLFKEIELKFSLTDLEEECKKLANLILNMSKKTALIFRNNWSRWFLFS